MTTWSKPFFNCRRSFFCDFSGSCSCVCTPDCTDRECGDDGCGGSCGTCLPGDVCDPTGTCVCIPDCAGKNCGDDGCGGSCGACPPGDVCDPTGTCVCIPDCAGKECGDDGCGGSCGSCDLGDMCDLLTRKCCDSASDSDGDGVCDANDCAPGDESVFGLPTEIGNLLMGDGDLIAWDSNAVHSGDGTLYQVLRGEMSNLPVGGPGETRLMASPGSVSVVDSAEPPLHSGYYYLVRGDNVCGQGTYGYDTVPVERTSASCP